MTLHDELLRALVTPDNEGVFPLNKIIDTEILDANYEESLRVLDDYNEFMYISPDIVLSVRDPSNFKNTRKIAIELETGYEWDFGDSLRQIKKYRKNKSMNWLNVIVIIPKEYNRFAAIYRNEYIAVFQWEAKGKYICGTCEEEHIIPITVYKRDQICPNKKKKDGPHTFTLTDLVDLKIEVPLAESWEKAPFYKI